MEKSGLKNVKLADIRPYANSEDYQKFLDKFKPVYTTDDCYTPPEVYEAVRKWVLAHYGIPEDREIVRPFYPGGDYEHYEYPDGCLVLDNPPFSMLSDILRFYRGKGIDFFLFCDSRYLANYLKASNAVACYCNVRYENGALVNTSYLTSLGDDRVLISKKLSDAVKAAQKAVRAAAAPKHPVLEYPSNVLTSLRLARISKVCDYAIKDLVPVKTLDCGQSLYGGGALISDRDAEALSGFIDRREGKIIELSAHEKELIEGLKRLHVEASRTLRGGGDPEDGPGQAGRRVQKRRHQRDLQARPPCI